MEVSIDNRYTGTLFEDEGLDIQSLVDLALFNLRQEGAPSTCELSLSFVDNEEIAELNYEYRHKEGPTDVLSFECDDPWEEDLPEDEPIAVGDIVIAPQVAKDDAPNYDVSFIEEMELLVTHGVLHLLGYDHMEADEAKVMEERQLDLLDLWRSGEDTGDTFHSGFVAMIGRPNAGKSTLTNTVIGEKIAIVSNTPQTTRHRLRGIYDSDDCQMIIVDTPGLHKPIDALGEELNQSALKALEDVDVVAMLIDGSKPVGRGDQWVAEHVAKARAHKILVITKMDLINEEQVAAQIEAAGKMMDWDDIIAVSAQEGFNTQGFINAVKKYLPEGPRWFPAGMGTDQPLEVLLAECIREKVLYLTHDEIPHAVGVQVTDVEYDEKRHLYQVYAYLYVERESQKGILIGKGGEMIKAIGSEARQDLARVLGDKVYLDLRVKVRKGWRKDATQIRRFGYGEGL